MSSEKNDENMKNAQVHVVNKLTAHAVEFQLVLGMP